MKKKPTIALLFSIRDLERMIEQIKASQNKTCKWEEKEAMETETGEFLIRSRNLEFVG